MRSSDRARALIGAALLMAGTSGMAQTAAGAHRMSVEQLLSLTDGTPYSPPSPDWSPAMTKRLAAESASVYMAGVIDGGEGKRWCVAASGQPPAEVDEQLVAALRAQAKPQDNAALAVATALSKRYPCAKKR